jgi:hypothetical protein
VITADDHGKKQNQGLMLLGAVGQVAQGKANFQVWSVTLKAGESFKGL